MESTEIAARSWSIGSARAVFTSSSDGNLALHVPQSQQVVLKNRASLEAQLGKPILFANQTHSDQVAIVETKTQAESFRLKAASVDALVTNRQDIALAMMVADCIPLLLADPLARVVAAVHAGRRGVVSKIASNTVAAMQDLGAEISNIVAFTGPSICGNCYEVPLQMQHELATDFPAIISQTSWGTPALDLPKALTVQLQELGIKANQVSVSPHCTLESAEYFSYREDQYTGRFAGIIWLEN